MGVFWFNSASWQGLLGLFLAPIEATTWIPLVSRASAAAGQRSMDLFDTSSAMQAAQEHRNVRRFARGKS
jgi:hypothetical protein